MKILHVAGARPNFMKIAPIMRAFSGYSGRGLSQVLVHTGQHYDEELSGIFFRELGISQPDYNLSIGSLERSEQIRAIHAAMLPIIQEVKPTIVLVVGDVNSTVGAARAAKECEVKVAHVEAGLRSFDASMPEELNRIETDSLSDFLFVTEKSGMDNLQKEGVFGRCFLAGNVMIDTLQYALPRIEASHARENFHLAKHGYVVATFHRPSNVDTKESLTTLLSVIRKLSERLPVVLPLHPRTRQSLEAHGLEGELKALSGVHLSKPLGYVDFMALVREARLVVTDSGGIQEETTFLRVPCVTVRANTERPVTVECGTNVLVGQDPRAVIAAVDAVLGSPEIPGSIPPLWDGRAAERICSKLFDELR